MKFHSFRFTFLVAMLLLCGSLYAQDNLKRGYIIRLDGEIVHGFIDVSDWGMNPAKVLFKTYPADSGIYYDPYDIREFGMNQEVWHGGFVDVELSSRDPRHYSTTPDLILEKDLVFLQMVIKGPKPLYVYSKAVNEQFYIRNGNEFELLVYKKYLKDVEKPEGFGTQTVMIENKKYQGQLTVYFEDCLEMQNAISKSNYTQNDLENLFYQYSKCTNTGFERLTPVKNISLKLGGAIGFAFTSLDFNFIEDHRIKELEPVNCKPMKVGMTLEISRPVSKPRWSIYNEFTLLTPYRHNYTLKGKESETVSYVDTYGFKFYSWKMVNMLRYRYPVGKFSFFGNAGITNEFYRGTWTRNYEFISPMVTNNHWVSTHDKLFVTRVAAGAGVRYSILSLEVRYEPALITEFAGSTTSFVFNVRF